MSDEKQKQYIKTLYEVIVDDISNFKGSKIDYYIDAKESILTSTEFILEYNSKLSLFIISFKIGEMAYKSAQIISILTKYLQPEEFLIAEDFYYDKKNKKIVYGEDAILERQLEILKLTGKDKCIICEGIYPNEVINSETGICKSCEKNYNDILWC